MHGREQVSRGSPILRTEVGRSVIKIVLVYRKKCSLEKIRYKYVLCGQVSLGIAYSSSYGILLQCSYSVEESRGHHEVGSLEPWAAKIHTVEKVLF